MTFHRCSIPPWGIADGKRISRPGQVRWPPGLSSSLYTRLQTGQIDFVYSRRPRRDRPYAGQPGAAPRFLLTSLADDDSDARFPHSDSPTPKRSGIGSPDTSL